MPDHYLYAFRRGEDSDWATEAVTSWGYESQSVGTSIAWLGADSAVVTFEGDSGSGAGQELQSIVHDGRGWEADLTDVPGEDYVFFWEHRLVGHPGGDALLVFHSFSRGGLFATWIRP